MSDPALAFLGDPTPPLGEEPEGREQLTVGATVVQLEPPDLADVAVVQTNDNPVRMRLGARDPSATLGLRLVAGDVIRLTGRATIRGARFVREGASSGTLEVEYFTRRRSDA